MAYHPYKGNTKRLAITKDDAWAATQESYTTCAGALGLKAAGCKNPNVGKFDRELGREVMTWKDEQYSYRAPIPSNLEILARTLDADGVKAIANYKYPIIVDVKDIERRAIDKSTPEQLQRRRENEIRRAAELREHGNLISPPLRRAPRARRRTWSSP